MASSSPPSSSSAPRKAQSLRRILREFEEIKASKNPFWTATPVDLEDLYEWHFTVRGPAGTEFEGGIYHGRIFLPQNYPLAPPSFTMFTSNGRFEIGKRVCLSASNYHPELWQPAWGIRTMLDALHAFFATPADGAVHSLDWPASVRRKLATESVTFKCGVCKEDNLTIAKKYCEDPSPSVPVGVGSLKNYLICFQELPPVLLPESVVKASLYLSGKVAEAAGAPTSRMSVPRTRELDEDESLEGGIPAEKVETPEAPQENESAAVQPEIVDEVAQNEERRRRRQRQEVTSRQDTRDRVSTLFIIKIFIVQPLLSILYPIFDGRLPFTVRLIRCMDISIVVLSIVTFLIILDLVRNPGELGDALLL